MPKTKRRKKASSRASSGSARGQGQGQVNTEHTGSVTRARSLRKPSIQNAVFSTMVALGCLGMAAFFVFFYPEDANHYLYGGVMAVTAAGWVIIAARRWTVYRRRASLN